MISSQSFFLKNQIVLQTPNLITPFVNRKKWVRVRPRGSPSLYVPSMDRFGQIKAVISKEAEASSKEYDKFPVSAPAIDCRAVITVRSKIKEKLVDKIEEQWQSFLNGAGRGIAIQLISEEIDTETDSGRKNTECSVKGWLPTTSGDPYINEYTADFKVPADFGRPGALLIKNLHNKEFFLMDIVLHGFNEGPIYFHANSWIHSQKDNPESRILFTNTPYLPSQTPAGLKDLRERELVNLRGNGKGERKKFDRIYDYATYNDLGNPDKSVDLARPILGGDEHPYPRRCRTGRLPTRSDPLSESRIEKPDTYYVPRDETFEEIKQTTFSDGSYKGLLHNLIPSLIAKFANADNSFERFSDIDDLYNDGVAIKFDGNGIGLGDLLITKVVTNLLGKGEELLKYQIPAIISRDRFQWLRDNEFARQALAGVNPVIIQRIKNFPILSSLDPEIHGPPESAITKEVVQKELKDVSVDEALEKGRLFIIDYHDTLLPYLKKINALKDRKMYASRTVFFLTETETLRPIAIELSLPRESSMAVSKRVYVHGSDATSHWIWRLAKAHASSNDAGIHQLVSHWLKTHACMEPYIIAAHRQLSVMHPIFKLLDPHMRYTFEINALARQSLINGGGVIESCFGPGKYSLELSSVAYKNWQFDMEALPADLLRRGMAVEDPSKPGGVRLIIEDYPYAADGLLIWSAIKAWVTDYVSHFYTEPDAVTSDVELQSWWSEIKNKGHADKRNEPWWPKLNTNEDLINILTIMIWTASGQHAAINFGQYPFGGYMPNRPTLMRNLMPDECDSSSFQKFVAHPESSFLSSLPTQLQTTKVMAVQDTLSTHSPDEEYLGQDPQIRANWINDKKILQSFKKFSARLEEIEHIINGRNMNKKLHNRNGAGIPPYELLLPSSDAGVTGRGIPNSISI